MCGKTFVTLSSVTNIKARCWFRHDQRHAVCSCPCSRHGDGIQCGTTELEQAVYSLAGQGQYAQGVGSHAVHTVQDSRTRRRSELDYLAVRQHDPVTTLQDALRCPLHQQHIACKMPSTQTKTYTHTLAPWHWLAVDLAPWLCAVP